jgi:hypothetical protein
VPAVERDDPDGDRDERLAQEAEGGAQRLAARKRDQHGPRDQEGVDGRPQPDEQQRRRDVGDQQVLAHVRDKQLVGERVDRPHQPERHAADRYVPGDLLPEGHRVAAAAEDADGTQVENLREQQVGDRAGRQGQLHSVIVAGSPTAAPAGG